MFEPLNLPFIVGLCLLSGHYCPGGDSTPIPCPAGQYQNETGQTACRNCPAGFYCISSTADPLPCPSGYYCLANTDVATKYPCPIGTFNNLTQADKATLCIGCLPG